METGANLEAVHPQVAHRQWTLSLPFAVRFAVVKRPKLLKRLEVRLVKAIWRWQRRDAKRLGADGKLRGGAVCFWQWFGSSLQLTPHLPLPAAARRLISSTVFYGLRRPHRFCRFLLPLRLQSGLS